MSYKERYRIENRNEIMKAEKRMKRLMAVLTVICLSTILVLIACLSLLDAYPTISLFVACIAMVILSSCLLLGEKLQDDEHALD